MTIYHGQVHVFAASVALNAPVSPFRTGNGAPAARRALVSPAAPGPASLRHDWWDGAHWHFEALDGPASAYPGRTPGSVGDSPSATVYNGQIHLFTGDAAGNLRHDWWDGAHWQFEALDGPDSPWAGSDGDHVGGSNVVALYQGQIEVLTLDFDTAGLRHDWWDGTGWRFEDLDGSASAYPGHSTNNVGDFTSVAVYGGQFHVFTSDITTGSTNNQTGGVLRHDWWDGSRWHLEVLDGPTSLYPGHTATPVGAFNSAIVFNSQLQVFSQDEMTPTLRHEWWG